MQDFKDPGIAAEWDSDTTTLNPLRPEQLDVMLAILGAVYEPGTAVLDIGMGSGQVEAQILDRVPEAYIVGVDESEAMLGLARERLRGHESRYSVVQHDLTETDTLRLPERDYHVAVSVQTIHNLPDDAKQRVIHFIYDALSPGGWFLLLDRIAIDTPDLFPAYQAVWQRLDRIHDAQMTEGATFEEHAQRVAERGDLPVSLDQNLEWLRGAGFEAACIHLHANRALLVARK